MRARLRVTITPGDIGRRVTIRARHHGPEAGTTDVVGTLTGWRDGVLTVVRRDGSERAVAETDLLAARVVPPPPQRRRRGPPRPDA